MVGVIGVENLAERHRARVLGSRSDDVTFLGILADIVVDMGTSLHRHPLESLIDAVLSSATLDDAEGHIRGPWLGDFIVRVG